MKKIIILLVAVLATGFISCKRLDSKPLEVDVIGTGYVHYNAKTGLHYVVIDSVQYTVTEVTVSDKDMPFMPPAQQLVAADGMLVTIFTSPNFAETRAVVGEQTKEQIEELYQTNGMILIIFAVFLIIVAMIILIPKTQKSKTAQ